MIIHRICELSVIVENEPASLPSLGPVDWVWEVPVWGHKQVTTFWYLSAGFVQLYRWGRVIFLQAKAVGAFALVENVRSKFPALHVSHGDYCCSVVLYISDCEVTVRWHGTRPRTTEPLLSSTLRTSLARPGELEQRGPGPCLPHRTGWLDTISYNWTFPVSHGRPYRKPSSIPMESCDPADRSWQSHLPSGHQGHTCTPRHFPTREIIMTTLLQTGWSSAAQRPADLTRINYQPTN